MSLALSLDIETTGLNRNARIIQIGAFVFDIYDDPGIGKGYEILVRHDTYNCEPYAAAMHKDIWLALAGETEGDLIVDAGNVTVDFAHWLEVVHPDGKIVVCGKNAAGFDIPRLNEGIPLWRDNIGRRFHHRVLDPAMLYWNPALDGALPPDSKTCMERAGMLGEVAHTALEDAIVVAKMVQSRAGYLKALA